MTSVIAYMKKTLSFNKSEKQPVTEEKKSSLELPITPLNLVQAPTPAIPSSTRVYMPASRELLKKDGSVAICGYLNDCLVHVDAKTGEKHSILNPSFFYQNGILRNRTLEELRNLMSLGKMCKVWFQNGSPTMIEVARSYKEEVVDASEVRKIQVVPFVGSRYLFSSSKMPIKALEDYNELCKAIWKAAQSEIEGPEKEESAKRVAPQPLSPKTPESSRKRRVSPSSSPPRPSSPTAKMKVSHESEMLKTKEVVGLSKVKCLYTYAFLPKNKMFAEYQDPQTLQKSSAVCFKVLNPETIAKKPKKVENIINENRLLLVGFRGNVIEKMSVHVSMASKASQCEKMKLNDDNTATIMPKVKVSPLSEKAYDSLSFGMIKDWKKS